MLTLHARLSPSLGSRACAAPSCTFNIPSWRSSAAAHWRLSKRSSPNAGRTLPVVRAGVQDGWSVIGQQTVHEEEDPELDFDTIAAVVTGAQTGAVSIIRLSGPEAVSVAQQTFRRAGKAGAPAQMESHRVYYGTVHDADGSRIDEVLLLCMLGPRSYTAEDVIEIHTHGGGICAQRVLQRCLEAGARLARPGEFTLRAFLNGRLDLAQAESVAQLIEARTVAAADSALAGLAGGLGKEVQEMRAECIDLLTEMDVRLDFDEDLPPLDLHALERRIEALSRRVERTLSTARQGQLLRTGLQVALVGRPNVGKSSLLNALSGTERAIVTEIAGTTRDIVEAGIVIGGVPITLLDTAGLRESSDKVERIGVERSLEAARQADIVLMVMDAQAGWTLGDEEIFRRVFFRERGPMPEAWNFSGASGDSDSWDLSSSGEENGGGGATGEQAAGSAAQHAEHAQRGRAPALLVVNKVDLAAESAAGNSAAAAQHSSRQAAQQQRQHHHQENNGAAPHLQQQQQQQGNGTVPQQQEQQQQEEEEGFAPAAAKSSPSHSSSSSWVPAGVSSAFSEVVTTSASTGHGLLSLKEAVLRLAGAPELAPGGVAWAVNERQAEALIRAQEALARVQASVRDGLPLDFWTIDLRGAALALGEVSGDDVTEEVLNSIFSKFCIGK